MADIENLLPPITDESPCGPDLDLAGDQAFMDLEIAAKGKEAKFVGDKELSKAEPPKWAKVRDDARALLAVSKDLRIAKHYVAALAHTEGLPGFAKGVGLLREWLQRYWTSLHPMLEGADDDWRARTVMEINAELGALAGLREASLAARFCVGDIEVADGSMPPKPDTLAASAEMLRDAIRASDAAATQALVSACDDSLKDLAAIQSVFRDNQNAICPEFPVIEKLLGRLGKLLAEATGDGGEVASGDAGEIAQDSSSQGVGAGPGTGPLRNRADARRLLETVCDFLERTEPSHPAPLLIRRGARLLDMSFVDIIRDLAPEAAGQIESLGGLHRE